MRSIAHRIYLTIAVITLVCVAVMVITTTLVNEDLEDTMLNVELAQERDYFLTHDFDPQQHVIRDTPSLILAYVPSAPTTTMTKQPEALPLPKLFIGLSTPFSGEIEVDKATYLITATRVESGTLYLARNITHFEQRELLFRMAMLVMVGLVALLSMFLAVLGARRVVSPLRSLASQIQRMPAGSQMSRLPSDWRDQELHTIAQAFNNFVSEIEAYVRREKSLLNLASHELRTPIAVISGALDVLEQRGDLTLADRRTAGRIRHATTEMQSNITILLRLARTDRNNPIVPGVVSVATEIQDVLSELSADYPVEARVQLKATSQAQIQADPIMVRMLLRNLLKNALQHTRRRIYVTVHDTYIELQDEGEGLSHEAQEILQRQRTLGQKEGPVTGLGLYLVTLMAERLGWSLQIVGTSERGTLLRLAYSSTKEPVQSALF